jgi:ABC-type nitrate/sulfonate/bicarbonate transport system permease component
VIRTAIPMIMSGEIFADVSISMVRVLVGFISGSLIGILFGVLLGRIRICTSCSIRSWSCCVICRPPP